MPIDLNQSLILKIYLALNGPAPVDYLPGLHDTPAVPCS